MGNSRLTTRPRWSRSVEDCDNLATGGDVNDRVAPHHRVKGTHDLRRIPVVLPLNVSVAEDVLPRSGHPGDVRRQSRSAHRADTLRHPPRCVDTPTTSRVETTRALPVASRTTKARVEFVPDLNIEFTRT